MKTYNKLVRDNIPSIIKQTGADVEYFKLEDSSQQEEFLKLKLIEEISELCLCENNEQRIEEIADVLEILEAYAKFHKINKFEVDWKKVHKASEKGKFNEFMILQTVDGGNYER